MQSPDKLKRLLIISPYFPPVNAADMQRVRMSLPYFEAFNWTVEVVTVDDKYVDLAKDQLLLDSIPLNITIHKVKAFSKKWTSKFGLGSLALRSLYFYRKKVNQLLRKKEFDLIYFSTTQFPVCILGAYWKKKFNIPFIIDMQDPWHSLYYQNKPKHQRPKKYWFSYRLNKYLEPIAMKSVDGIISVSSNYIDTLQQRYPILKDKPAEVITFGAFNIDFEIVEKHEHKLPLAYENKGELINILYIGRGGYDMEKAIRILFNCFKKGLSNNPKVFQNIRFHFIGTSYAPKGVGIETITPIAKELGVSAYIQESTDRIGFYEALKNLKSADGLFIMGSDDTSYTASKLYPYILANKPLLSIFNKESSAYKILKECDAGELIKIDEDFSDAFKKVNYYINKVINKMPTETNWLAFESYTSYALTQKQVQVFDKVITDFSLKNTF